MSSVGAVDVFVDFAELGRVQTELQNLVALVENLDDLCAIDVDGAAMGGNTAAAAVDEFGRRWRDGRHAISENLARCQTYVGLALEGYGQAEHTVGTAIEAIAAVGIGVVRTTSGGGVDRGGGGAR